MRADAYTEPKGEMSMKQMDWLAAGKRVGIGAAAAVGAAAVLCGLVGALISAEVLPISAGVTAAPVMLGLCLFGACYLVARSVPQSRLPVSLAVAVTATLLCLFAKALFFPSGTVAWDWRFLLPLAAALGAGVLSSRKKTRRR